MKITQYCSNTSTLLKNALFTLPGLAILQLSQSSKRTQNRNTPFTTEARVVRQTQRFFFFYCWSKCRCIRVPSKACGGKVALQRARLRVRACTERLLSPCHHVSSSTYLFGWTDLGARTASSGANTTKVRSQQGQKKTKRTSVLNFAIWDDMAVIFTVYKAARRLAKREYFLVVAQLSGL